MAISQSTVESVIENDRRPRDRIPFLRRFAHSSTTSFPQTRATFGASLRLGLLLGACLISFIMIMKLAHDLHPLSGHMLSHIALMNIGAPAIAFIAFASTLLARSSSARLLVIATCMQSLLLWAWHAPPLLAMAMVDPLLQRAMSLSLFCSALWFWLLVIGQEKKHRWRAIVALLFSGKLFCLLAALLTFAPRPLYECASDACSNSNMAPMLLVDQQLAGLIMLVACPLTFVVSGIVLAAGWLSDLSRTRWRPPTPMVAMPAVREE